MEIKKGAKASQAREYAGRPSEALGATKTTRAITPTVGDQTPRGCRCSPVPVFGYRTRQTLQRLDVSRLQTLGALLRFEAHLLVFSQRLEAVAADFREVSEQVVAALVRCNEAKAFAVVEPLNGTGIHEEPLR